MITTLLLHKHYKIIWKKLKKKNYYVSVENEIKNKKLNSITNIAKSIYWKMFTNTYRFVKQN